MPAPSNLSFETASATPGIPLDWDASVVCTAARIATYSDLPWERFSADEGWDATYLGAFASTDLDGAEYQLLPREGFEMYWDNVPWLTELSLAETALYNGGADPIDDCEWGVWKTTFDPGDLAEARYWFTTRAVETFDALEGWDNAYVTELIAVQSAQYAYMSGGGSVIYATYEGFLQYRPQHAFSVDTTLNYITTAGPHNMFGGSVHEPHYFVAGGVLPAPLAESNRYYATYIDADTFTSSLNPAGTPVENITDYGIGINYVHGDPAVHWIWTVNV
jgi:hypothetical protein